MLKDRRQTARRPVPFADSISWIFHKGRSYPTHLVDRSERGLGLTIRQRPPVVVGNFVRVEWLKPQASSCEAQVRFIEPLGDGEWFVGLEQDAEAYRETEDLAADAVLLERIPEVHAVD